MTRTLFRGFRLAGVGAVIFTVAGFSLSAQAAGPSGKQIARQTCSACHGLQGAGNPQAGFPRIAGHPAAYLEAQLRAFAAGQRANAIMQGEAKQLSPAELQAVSRYYAQLESPARVVVNAKPQTLREGRETVVNGRWQKNIPSCESCHGPGARGIAPSFPPLAGQNVKYLEAQFRAWKSGHRPGGPDDLMQHIAQQLDTHQIHAAAEYLASLPPTGKLAAGTQADVAPSIPDALPGYFQPPIEKDLPQGKFGESVHRGYLIFTRTPKYAVEYTGNGLSCSNCHTDRGRQANASPMWAAWVAYPAYRGKNKKVNDMAMRLQGCFRYSENAQGSKAGHFPPAESPILIDLESYMFWMAHKAPTGVKMKGRGYPRLKNPPQPYSRNRGEEVYARSCAVCHGSTGQGKKLANGEYAFPPLWGSDSYNWGAGMHKVNVAAAFIKYNMPLGHPGMLTLQEAWDVAAWIDSHPRPQDPRYHGGLKATIHKFHHNRKIDYYGKTVDGRVLGAPSPGKTGQNISP